MPEHIGYTNPGPSVTNVTFSDSSVMAIKGFTNTAAIGRVVGARQIQVRQLYISAGHNYFEHHGRPAGENPIVEVARIECIAGRGVRGDRFFDYKEKYKGQITFFAWETYERVCAAFEVPNCSAAAFRRNVITINTDLNLLIGKDFWIQGLHFRGTEECRPCYRMDQAVAPGACEFLKGHGGLRAEILNDGFLCANGA